MGNPTVRAYVLRRSWDCQTPVARGGELPPARTRLPDCRGPSTPCAGASLPEDSNRDAAVALGTRCVAGNSCLLPRGGHHTDNGFHQPVEATGFQLEVRAARCRKAVIAGTAVVLRLLPFLLYPALYPKP